MDLIKAEPVQSTKTPKRWFLVSILALLLLGLAWLLFACSGLQGPAGPAGPQGPAESAALSTPPPQGLELQI